MKRTPLIIILLLGATLHLKAQQVAVKTNLLYGVATLTPNLGVEIGLGERTTLDLVGSYNWFNLNGTVKNNKKLAHWMVQSEFRYYLCKRLNGHFFGVHGLFSHYNIADHELPLLFGAGSKAFRYEGTAMGAGLSYGYRFAFSEHWGAEASIGLGYAYLSYDKYNCYKCSQKVESNANRHYFGPTKAALSLVYTW